MKKMFTRSGMMAVLLLMANVFLTGSVFGQTYQPVAVTGFNTDVVANGSDNTTNTTSGAVDVQGNVFYQKGYSFCNAGLTRGLPANGIVTSAGNTGVNYVLANYTGNNTLVLQNSTTGTLAGTLVFNSTVAYDKIAILVTSADASSTYNSTVNFNDNTSTTYSATAPDWYDGSNTNLAIGNIGRVNRGNCSGTETGGFPKLFDNIITLSSADKLKQIKSISFTKTNSQASRILVFAVSGLFICPTFTINTNTVSACPSQSNGSITVSSVTGGTAPYDYSLNGGVFQTGTTFSNLAANSYTLTVRDANGCMQNQSVTVGTGSAPSFTTDLSQSNAVCAGNNITYNVAATGTGPLSFQWFKDGVPVNNTPTHIVINSTATTSSLTINNIVPTDAGNYTVTVTGACSQPAMSGQGALTVYTKPVFTACPGNINTTTSSDGTGNCSAAVSYTTTATSTAYPASGGTAPLTFNYSYQFSNSTTASGSGTGSPAVFNKGTTNVVVTATNTCGSVTCNFTITVADDEAPAITCTSNKTVSTNANACAYTNTGTGWNATATDNCGTAGLAYTYTLSDRATTYTTLNGVQFNKGITTVTATVNDGANTSAPCNFTVTVNDTELPVITCPGNITKSNDAGQCSAVVTYAASASDNCPGTVITYSPASGSTFPKGTTTVTATATDASSNVATCTFTVTVNDNELPVITCPANVTQNNDAGQCGAIVTYPAAMATDNCGIQSITYSKNSGTSFPVGTTTVTATATDVNNNVKTCQFTVTVTDTEAPIITSCPIDITTNNSSSTDGCGASVTFAATASDNCSAVVTYTIPGTPNPMVIMSPYTFPVGITTVTVTATDPAGNTPATCTFTVTVNNVTGNLYVNDGSTTGDAYTNAAGNDGTGNGTKCKPYLTINKAISVASAGNTIFVDAGAYAENVIVDKQLTINGPNAAINPCSGGRVPEAVVVPAAPSAISYGEVFHVAASNVSIKGFTIDGNNPALTSGYLGVNGADIDAAEGITVYEDNINNLTASNNIIKNLSYFGITMNGGYDPTPPYSSHGIPSTGHIISNNSIQDLGTYDAGSGIARWGGGVLLAENQYAAVTNNCMDRVRLGVQTGNYYRANPGTTASQLIDGNTIINLRRTGIFHNLAYSLASPYTVSNNTITGTHNVNETKWDGILLASLSVPSTTSGNSINATAVTQASSGIEVWNVKNTTPAAISGGSVTGATNGVFVNNYDGFNSDASPDGAHATVSGVTITPSAGGNGIRVYDNPSSSHANVQATIGAGVIITNGTNGLVVENTSASVPALGNVAFMGQTGDYIKLINNANNINATTATFNGNTGASAGPAGNFAIEDKINHKIDFLPLGFVTVFASNAFVTDIAPLSPTATNNDYTRVRNGILAVSNNFTINHTGTFNWVEPNAAASWALGNDGLTGTTPTSNDDYSILVPTNLNGVTFTAPIGLGDATIQGPGDLSGANLEGVLVFDGGDNQNWTISKMQFYDFDLSIGMFNGAGGVDAFNNTTITNNTFRIANDLNATIAPTDVNQNIGIHYSFGTNQTISNNIFNVPGNGVSDGTNLSSMVVMQSNTSGGTAYDGLNIQNNTINITDAQSANPSRILGIWENGNNQDATINISGNILTNVAGNNPSLNIQRAFRITSKSGATKNIVYQNNEVTGANIAFEWIAGYSYPSGATPVQLLNNKVDTTYDAVVVRGNGASALVNNNSFTRNVRYAINNEAGTGTAAATCNWYGTANANTIATLINGLVTYIPYLTNGIDNDLTTRGFQTTAPCNGTPVTIAVIATVNESCGKNDGSITVAASGGSTPYTYAITPSPATIMQSISGTFTGLPAGTYTITVTDGNTSTATTTATLTYNPIANTTSNTTYTTIQAAIDAAAPNDVLQICAGQYVENLIVPATKTGLKIYGPNASITSCTGTRLPEAMLLPATSQPFYDGSTETRMMQIRADNVEVKGLTFNGNNTALTTNVIDAADGIDIYEDKQGIILQNNIFQNLNESGITGQPSGGSAMNGNSITNNRFTNIPGNFNAAYPLSGYGIGVLVYNNFYATVDNNCMTNVRIGVQTGNFNLSGSPASISNNQIQSKAIGIWHNLAYQSASTFTISGNQLTTATGATTNTGLFVSSIASAVSTNISGNIIGDNANQTKWGIELWNNPTTNPVTISGGTLTNCETGIFTNNYDSYQDPANLASGTTTSIINGVIINGGTTGIHVKDNTANTNNAQVVMQIQGGTTINNSGTGLRIEGGNASASFNGLTPAIFTGQTKYITYASNGTDWPVADINATAVKFDGSLGSGKTLPELFATEDKIDHKIDYAGTGFVTVYANNTYVTPNSFIAPTTTEAKIQRGVDAAEPTGFTLHVQGNSLAIPRYADNVTVSKEIIILGPNDAVNPNTGGTRVAEAIVVPAISSLADVAGRVFNVTANNVTIKGFTVDGDNPVISSSGTPDINGADIDASSGIATGVYQGANGGSNILIENNIIKNFDNDVSSTGAIYGNGSQSAAVTGNSIVNNKIDNSTVWGIITEANWYANIQGNVITTSNRGIQADGYFIASPTVTSISGNTISYYKRGITVNNNFGNASQFAVSNNTISPQATGTNEDGGTGAVTGQTLPNKAIAVWSMFSGTAGVTTSGNTITGSEVGAELWNIAPGKFISTSDVINNAGTGILIETNHPSFNTASYGTYATITQANISGSTTDGILLTDNNGAGGPNAQLNLTNTYVTGGTNSIRITGADIATSTAINTNSLTGASAKAINASAYTGATAIYATCNWYGSNVAATVATRISGSVTYVPYLSSGAETDPTPGFQPTTPCTNNCTPITATITQTNNTCNGGSTGTIKITNTSGGVPDYTYTLSGTGSNNTGNSNGQYTGLPAGTYTVTAFGSNGCSTSFTPVTITAPTATVPDASISIATSSGTIFVDNGSTVTFLIQVQENAGNPITAASLNITDQDGYTFEYDPTLTSIQVRPNGQIYQVANTQWDFTPANPNEPVSDFDNTLTLRSGNQVSCLGQAYLAIRLRRTTPNKSNFVLTSFINGVNGPNGPETVTNNNSTTFFLVGQ